MTTQERIDELNATISCPQGCPGNDFDTLDGNIVCGCCGTIIEPIKVIYRVFAVETEELPQAIGHNLIISHNGGPAVRLCMRNIEAAEELQAHLEALYDGNAILCVESV